MKNMNKGEKKSYRAAALKIVHYFDDKDVARRDDLLQDIVAKNNYSEEDVNDWIKKLHTQKIIKVTKGRYSEVSIA
jgi:hypothetical protein